MRATTLATLASFALVGCASEPEGPGEGRTPALEAFEGTYRYLPPLRGQAMVAKGRFAFLYGSAEGDDVLTAEAGRYRLAGDTIWNTIEYSTDPDRRGQVYGWTYRPGAGDTVLFTVYDEAGRVTGGGRTVRVP